MPVYAKKTLVTAPRFSGRVNSIYAADKDGLIASHIPVPNDLVLCNGCNRNLCEAEVVAGEVPFGYLIYLGKRELNNDQPYDIYCEDCTKRYFPKAVTV